MQENPLTPESIDQFRHYLLMNARHQLDGQLQSKVDPADLVQQTLHDAHRDWGQFNGKSEAELAAWLRRILENRVVDVLRAYRRDRRNVKRERSLESSLSESRSRFEEWLHCTDRSPADQAAENERLEHLRRVLKQLTAKQRQAIELYYLEGKTLAEVASAMGRSRPTVLGLLQRGLIVLRKELKDFESSNP